MLYQLTTKGKSCSEKSKHSLFGVDRRTYPDQVTKQHEKGAQIRPNSIIPQLGRQRDGTILARK